MNTIMTLPIILCDDDTLLLSHYKSVIENWIMINDYEMKLVLATTDPEDIFLFLKNNKFTNSLFFLDIDLGNNLMELMLRNGSETTMSLQKLFLLRLIRSWL